MRRGAWLAVACAAMAARAGAEPRVPEPTVRETRGEFLDSLADDTIARDPSRIYRKDGARREIDMGGGFTASLDEVAPTRFDSPVSVPGQAAAPSRVAGITLRRPGLFGELTHARSAVTRNDELALRWDLFDVASLVADTRESTSTVAGVDARRRDSFVGLRWPAGATNWIEAGVQRATIAPDSGISSPDTAEGGATFWRLRGRWLPESLPGLTLGATAMRALTRDAGPLAAGKLEFVADYALQSFGLPGTRLVWREAPRLGLLSEGQALEPAAAFKRSVGIEAPDGSPGGIVYAQWRSRSVASDDDSIAVLGWRHAWRPAQRWLLQSHVEQAIPVAGPNAVRSFSIGGRLWRGAFPDNSFVTELSTVNSERNDSLFAQIKYTWRIGDQLLAALRARANHTQPHGQPDSASTDYRVSAGIGWREPIDKRFSALGRWTFNGTEVREASATDRRAHIVLTAFEYHPDDTDALGARWSRRWERDEVRPALDPRATTLLLGRWVHEVSGARWSASAHLARRNDDLDGNATSVGAEVGYRLSRKAVLAFGYNPKGFDDHEIEFDERLNRGFTLRLRFTIDAALGRWFDAAERR